MYIPDEKTNRRRKWLLTICLLLAVAGSLAAVAWRWSNGVDAQNHGVRVMFVVVDRFLEEHAGRWPESWKELQAIPVSGQWYEPVNYASIRKEVIIDFDVDLPALAEQSPGEFQAIRPRNPVFDFAKDPRLVALLSTIRKYHGPTSATP